MMSKKAITTRTDHHYFGALVALTALAMVAVMLLTASRPSYATATFVVNSTADQADVNLGDGVCDSNPTAGTEVCTLRAAIQEANDRTDDLADTINFNIPTSGVATISPASALPSINGPVNIDGYTQTGASPNSLDVGNNALLKVELNGSSAGSGGIGLQISSSGCLIRGLVINSFGFDGMLMDGASSVGNHIEGNFIGTDPTGTVDQGNGGDGVDITGSSQNVVGGDTPDKRNVISGNDEGVFLGSNANRVEGNYIGTDKSGKEDLGNVHGGVTIISGSANNTVGGTTSGSRNVISGNDSIGVDINGSRGTKVLGNRIGTTVNGMDPLGNDGEGVFIIGGSLDNQIGDGTAAGSNTIAFNYFDGVTVCDGTTTGNKVSRNSIFSNGGLGIDLLGPDENRITNFSNANDAGDTDSGPKGLQNTHLLTSAKTLSGKSTIKGKLNSTPGKTFSVRLFSNPSGANEGENFVGQKTVTTDGSGTATFAFSTTTRVPVGRSITATATGAAGTSEFSAPRTVASS